MDNIFTHNITDRELKQIVRMIPGREIPGKALYEKSVHADLKNADLFRLYSLRKDNGKANSYFNKIDDEVLKYLLKN